MRASHTRAVPPHGKLRVHIGERVLRACPVLLGRGKRLFDACAQASALRLEQSKVTSRGGGSFEPD